MLKVILSPAKSLDFNSTNTYSQFTKPYFTKAAKTIDKKLKTFNVNQLQDLLQISSSLAELNVERNKKRNFFQTKIDATHRQAIFVFNGDVYKGFDMYNLDGKHFDYLQNHLLILSGLYGILKPFDIIEPYRLEMGINIQIEQAKNLYAYWEPMMEEYFNKKIKKEDIIVNLASQEYFKAIPFKKLKQTVINLEFKELKNNKLQTISFFAKKARGLMARYIVENELYNINDLKLFNKENYQFTSELSTPKKWVFTR